MLDMDVPKGYVSRIRRTTPLAYPTCSDDFVLRLIPLIQLASVAKQKMEKTLKEYQNTSIELQMARRKTLVLPLCPFPSSPSECNSKTESSSSSPSNVNSYSSSSSASPLCPSEYESSESASKRQKQSL